MLNCLSSKLSLFQLEFQTKNLGKMFFSVMKLSWIVLMIGKLVCINGSEFHEDAKQKLDEILDGEKRFVEKLHEGIKDLRMELRQRKDIKRCVSFIGQKKLSPSGHDKSNWTCLTISQVLDNAPNTLKAPKAFILLSIFHYLLWLHCYTFHTISLSYNALAQNPRNLRHFACVLPKSIEKTDLTQNRQNGQSTQQLTPVRKTLVSQTSAL